jgi:CRP-like cAMP-binding protein
MEQITLEARDFDIIQSCGTVRHYQPGDLVFSEGEPAETVYFIESGKVSIFLHEFTNRVEIGQRGAGSFFGEMAVISQGKRTASVTAVTDSKLIVLDKEQFLNLMATDNSVNEKVGRVIKSRTEELALKENLLSTTGIRGNHLQISIKGDPSLRETVFDRERRESPMDKVLPELVPKLQTLLLDRCVSEISLHFNSGEIRLTSIFDPFNYEIHPANKLIDTSYLDRHFPVLAYEDKTRLIHQLYASLATEFNNLALPGHYMDSYKNRYQNWQPLAQEEIVRIIDKLQILRTIPNFYLRNMGISITRDAIRMQFNCDGTHIVSTKDYDTFLADNLGVEVVV